MLQRLIQRYRVIAVRLIEDHIEYKRRTRHADELAVRAVPSPDHFRIAEREDP
jgi:hypothetical protein